MPWCPDCRIEYDPGIITCADCDAFLVEELPEIRIGPPPEVVFVASTAPEAQIVKATLEAAGIPAYVQATSVAWPGESITDTASPDLRVLVEVDRLADARVVLAEKGLTDDELDRLANSSAESSE